MNDRQMRSFFSVARCHSFSAAAEKQFISPQALIQQINLLEEEVGVKLLERTNRGIVLTPAGERFYQEMTRLTGEAERLLQEIRKGREKGSTLNIGLFENSLMMQRICARFAQERPDVLQRYILVDSTDWLSALDAFSNGGLDILEHVDTPDVHQKGLSFTPLERISCACAMEAFHPLAQKGEIRISDLDGQEIRIHHESCVHGLAKKLAEEAPRAVLKSDRRGSAAAFEICGRGGVFITSENFVKKVLPLTVVPLQAEFNWIFGLVYPKKSGYVVEDFVRCAKTVCHGETL